MLLVARARMWQTFTRALRAEPANISQLPFRVRWVDCDLNFHLTNSRYFQLMDAGRFDLLLRSRALWQLLRARLNPAVVELEMTFRRELRPGQPFILDTRIVAIEGKAARIEQHFIVDGQIHAKARLKMLALKRGRVVSPKMLRPLISPPLSIYRWRVVDPNNPPPSSVSASAPS